jgi:ferredoxin
MAKLSVNKETCIGCGTCESICPKLFKVNEGKAHPRVSQVKGKDEECAKKAVQSCPVSAISVEQ